MSGEKKQPLNVDEHVSDEEQIENTTTDLDNKAQESLISSGATDQNLEDCADKSTTEVDSNDIITIEEISHESSGQSSSENSGCTVIYEFPNDCEIGAVNHVCGACTNYVDSIPYNQKPIISDHSEFRPILQINENQKKELDDTKAVNKDALYVASVAETSGETDRKRKMLPSSSQNKRHKEMQSPSNPATELPCQSHEDTVQVGCRVCTSEDEFADVEDNVKESSSSDSGELDSIKTVEKASKDLVSDIQSSKGCETESRDASEFSMANFNFGSHLQDSQNIKSVDKNDEKTPLTSSLKAETVPEIDFSNITKNKFQLPMTTIFESPESESDEQIPQPMQSKTNPLKMKTSVVKRKDRCNVCNVRIGLCAIKCRCGGYYCAKHRYDREHNCTFDYKSMGAEEIRKNNPRITAEKVRKL